MKTIFNIIKNKYLIAILVFLVWIVFFDSNRLISVQRHRNELKKVNREKDYYQKEIEHNKKLLELYQTNIKALENFARENYLMKKDNEDIFLIVEE